MPSPPPPSGPDRPGTLLETDDDIRQALQPNKPSPPAAPAARPPDAAPPSAAKPYCPTLRPPIVLLTALDDGKGEGEVIRIRTERFVIGRSEGDFLVPHDELISGRQVDITRQRLGGTYRWVVTDLQTRNGLFVRVSRTSLADRAEFLVGKGRYRFEAPSVGALNTVDFLPPDGPSGSTRGWTADAAPNQQPVLVELLAGGTGARVPLVTPEYWIGRDPTCAICRADDLFVEPRHVRLSRDPNGGCHAQNNKASNGLWYKVPQITVEDGCLFQIGEQRFRMKVGG
jgi:pSer/pThr/pTyr-binding forkhead associated (FHA) protein